MKKVDEKLMRLLKPIWNHVRDAQGEYWEKIADIEEYAKNITGIEDIEIFHCEGEAVGIGNTARTMPLIHSYELEK